MANPFFSSHSEDLLKRRFKDGIERHCLVPFIFLSISGKRLVPCPWLRNIDDHNTVSLKSLIQYKDLNEVWTSQAFSKVRKEIREQSYISCDLEHCPQFMGKQWWMRTWDEIARDFPKVASFLKGQTLEGQFPLELSLGYDSHCNLECPSCDRDLQPCANEKEKKLIFNSLASIGPQATRLTLAGMGDPFGTPHYFELLKNFPFKHFPKLEHIVLQTNGLLLYKKWNLLPEEVRRLCNIMTLSIDGASRETYEKNRFPGKWTELLKTLDFLKHLQETKTLKELHYTYVVQQNNYNEMNDFIKLVEGTKPHTIFFTRLSNWKEEHTETFFLKDIQNPKHPEYSSFLIQREEIEKIKVKYQTNIVFMDS